MVSKQQILPTLLLSTLITWAICGASYSGTLGDQVIPQGKVKGLKGTLTLESNWGETLKIRENGDYEFTKPQEVGAEYKIQISHMPAGQLCKLISSEGKFSLHQTPNEIICHDRHYFLGGQVKGLKGEVVIQTQWGDMNHLNQNGHFTMPAPLTIGTPYTVTMVSQPREQNCRIINGSGIIATTNINSVQVQCDDQIQTSQF